MALKKVNTDQKILDLIKEVERRKKEIYVLEKPAWLTNCSFSYGEDKLNDVVNIHVVSDIKTLISIAAFLLNKDESYKNTAIYLNVESPPTFTWGGFKIADWVTDIKTRINQSQITSKRKKLEELENRLNMIITPELKAQMELEAITNELL